MIVVAIVPPQNSTVWQSLGTSTCAMIRSGYAFRNAWNLLKEHWRRLCWLLHLMLSWIAADSFCRESRRAYMAACSSGVGERFCGTVLTSLSSCSRFSRARLPKSSLTAFVRSTSTILLMRLVVGLICL